MAKAKKMPGKMKKGSGAKEDDVEVAKDVPWMKKAAKGKKKK